jgi:hypothetical protein
MLHVIDVRREVADADDQNLVAEAVDTEAVEVPSWVPEKFKANPEKFGEAYQNLEREFHQTKQQVRAAQEQVEALIEAQSQQQQNVTQDQVNPYYTAYEQAMEAGDYARAAAIQDELAVARMRQLVEQESEGFYQADPAADERASRLHGRSDGCPAYSRLGRSEGQGCGLST